MTQKEVFADIRKELGDYFQDISDESLDRLTQGTFLRLKYQFKDLIR